MQDSDYLFVPSIVFQPIEKPKFEKVEEFEETERGNGGFGSSGRA